VCVAITTHVRYHASEVPFAVWKCRNNSEVVVKERARTGRDNSSKRAGAERDQVAAVAYMPICILTFGTLWEQESMTAYECTMLAFACTSHIMCCCVIDISMSSQRGGIMLRCFTLVSD
jgi:hypothetical protein